MYSVICLQCLSLPLTTVFPGLKANEGTAITFDNDSNHKHGPRWPKEEREISESAGNQGLISFSLEQPSDLLAVGGMGSISPSKDRSVPQPLEPVRNLCVYN